MNRAQRRELRRFAQKIGVRVYEPSPEEYLTVDVEGRGWEINYGKLEKDIADRPARGDMYRRVFEHLNAALPENDLGECPESWMHAQHECEWNDNGPIPAPFNRKRWRKVFLPSEIRIAEEWCIEDGTAPEPTVDVETMLARLRWYGATVFFRWALTPFRFRPDSRIGMLLNRIRPGMGGSATFNGRRGHWRNQWYPSTQSHKRIFIPEIPRGGE